jgi:Ca2+-binding RTX toxin-like protein
MFDGVEFYCNNLGNRHWGAYDGAICDFGQGPVECPELLGPDVIPRYQTCIGPSENPNDYLTDPSVSAAIRNLCLAKCEETGFSYGFIDPEFARQCSLENIGDPYPKLFWDPGEAANCNIADQRNGVVDMAGIDWSLAGLNDFRPALGCDLNETCCREFRGPVCQYLGEAALSLSGSRGADYDGEFVGDSLLRINMPGDAAETDDAELIQGNASYSALDCGDQICPFYLANLTANAPGKVWDIRLQTVRKDIKNLQVDLMQSVLGGWDTTDGAILFQPGSIRLRVQFDVEGPVVKDGDGHYDIEVENDSIAAGTFIDGHVTLTTRFAIGDDGEGTLELDLAPISAPPVAATSLTGDVECNAPDGYVFAAADDQSFDPDGDLTSSAIFVNGGPNLNGAAPFGVSEVSVLAFDARDAVNESAPSSINVVDTGAPSVTAASTSAYVTCSPGQAPVTLTPPMVSDVCADPEALGVVGEIIEINGATTSIAVSSSYEVTLPPGAHVVRWTVTDPSGNSTTIEEGIDVEYEASVSCCAVGQSVLLGNAADDWFFASATSSVPQCVLTFEGADDAYTGAAADIVYLAEGHDYWSGRGGADFADGGPGDDILTAGAGNDEVYGGPGEDDLYGGTQDDFLSGGLGDDHIQGQEDNDVITGGGGADYVAAGSGNDVVWVYDVCELEGGEYLNGGSGTDVLYLPISKPAAEALGVTILGFESIVFTPSNLAGLAECG